MLVRYAHAADRPSVAQLSAAVAAANPGYTAGTCRWDEAVAYVPEGPGVRYAWLATGEAEVYLPAGYRTQEGDGEALPAAYEPDTLDGAAAAHLDSLRRALNAGEVDERIAVAIERICARRSSGRYQGDIAGDLWTLLESGVPPAEWVSGVPARRALAWLIERFDGLGWSTKRTGGWEAVLCGDLLVAVSGQPLRVRGKGAVWWIEDRDAGVERVSRVRRLRHLRDTAGGCSPGFDAFRRLALTWRMPAAQRAWAAGHLTGAARADEDRSRVDAEIGSAGTRSVAAPDMPSNGTNGAPLHPVPAGIDADHPNRLNSHVLHIEAAQSRTHYHPVQPVGGGRSQCELYFGLDPAGHGLHASVGAAPRLYTFPRPGEWEAHDSWEIEPGVAVFIPPGVGHRGVDAFVNVVTIPGFKPGNEIYVDRLIAESGRDAPFYEAAAAAGAPVPG